MLLVSCRTTTELIEATDRLGIPSADYLGPLGIDRAALTDPAGTVEWTTVVRVVKSLSRLLGDDVSRLRAVGRNITYVPAYRPLRLLARSTISVPHFYRVAERWIIPAHFPHARLFIKLASRERLLIHFAIPEPYAPCEPFFHIATGAVAEMPVLLGRQPAEILDAAVTPRSLDLVLRLPRGGALFTTAIRGMRALFGSYSTNLVLEQQRIALAEGLESVQRAGDELKNILDRQPGMVVIHSASEIVFVNRALVRGLGWSDTADLVGRSLSEIAPESSMELFASAETAGAETAAPTVRQGWLSKRDGSSLLVEATAAQHVIFRGEPALLTVATDIGERERMREQLATADRLATLGLLAAGVAHEINNPLAYVLNNIELARKHLDGLGPDTELPVNALDVALEGVDRIRCIVRDLLLLARADHCTVGPTDLWPVVESTLALTRAEIDRTAKLVLDPAPAPQVRASAPRLGQIVLNLVLNALEAMRPRPRTQNELTIRVGDAPPGRAFLEVSDNGPGIQPHDAPRVLEPFFTTKPAGNGTGLGLAITQRLVLELNGELTFTSKPGKGTTFRVVLPAMEA